MHSIDKRIHSTSTSVPLLYGVANVSSILCRARYPPGGLLAFLTTFRTSTAAPLTIGIPARCHAVAREVAGLMFTSAHATQRARDRPIHALSPVPCHVHTAPAAAAAEAANEALAAALFRNLAGEELRLGGGEGLPYGSGSFMSGGGGGCALTGSYGADTCRLVTYPSYASSARSVRPAVPTSPSSRFVPLLGRDHLRPVDATSSMAPPATGDACCTSGSGSDNAGVNVGHSGSCEQESLLENRNTESEHPRYAGECTHCRACRDLGRAV
eukprot:scaffold207902_cov27-Tisochrysis_lutea.AAC.3